MLPIPEGQSSDDPVESAVRVLAASFPDVPRAAVVLGSGMGALEESLRDPIRVSFVDLPGLPGAGVAGHGGRFVHGTLGGVPVILQMGRFHGYEGHAGDVVVRPVRILAALGVRALLMTSAVGGVHPRLEPGDLVRVDDQIDLTARSPLTGPVVPGDLRFPDMSAPFDRNMADIIRAVAIQEGVALLEGTYAGVTGPAYETAAEVAMIAKLGGDVVGMSTIPEVVTAAALGLRCAVIALVTNRATGRSSTPLSHDEVLTAGRDAGARLTRLIRGVVAEIDHSDDAK